MTEFLFGVCCGLLLFLGIVYAVTAIDGWLWRRKQARNSAAGEK